MFLYTSGGSSSNIYSGSGTFAGVRHPSIILGKDPWNMSLQPTTLFIVAFNVACGKESYDSNPYQVSGLFRCLQQAVLSSMSSYLVFKSDEKAHAFCA